MSTNEFPNPQQSSTPIHVPATDPSVMARPKMEPDAHPITRTAHSLLHEQFQLKQLMMEQQVFLFQQEILEKELHQNNTAPPNDKPPSLDPPSVSSKPPTPTATMTTRGTSPIKGDSKRLMVEHATSPVKQPTTFKQAEKPSKRSVQTQRFDMNQNDEDLLILSLNESFHEPKPQAPSNAAVDPDEQNLLKDIFFICLYVHELFTSVFVSIHVYIHP